MAKSPSAKWTSIGYGSKLTGWFRSLFRSNRQIEQLAGAPDAPPRNVRVATEDGQTVVYITHNTTDAGIVTIRQEFPPAIQHHYKPSGVNEDIPLYSGTFSLASNPQRPLHGDIRFTWNPTPRVIARGGGNDTSFVDDILDGEGVGEVKWQRMGDVVVDDSQGVPPQPCVADARWDRKSMDTWIEDRIATLNVGNGDKLDTLTFLVPNGWQSVGGGRVRDRTRPWVWWDGRITAEALGWRVVIEPTGRHDSAFWSELKASGSSRITHVGQITRIDGASFAITDTELPLNATRLALSLAVGRSIQCLLPVGWRDGDAAWAMWHCGGVDRMRSVHSLVDLTEAGDQVKEIIERCLLFSSDPYKQEVLQYAISYYITANYDVNAELAVALPVSALQLIAYHRFVEDRQVLSKGQWKNLNTEAQIRTLLSDCSVDLSVPGHFQKLQSVRTTLGLSPDGNLRDALGCIIKMRNNIIHPTRDKPAIWTAYQWVEASEIALDYLRYAVLNQIGFSGNIRTAAQQSKQTGSLTRVPWVP